MRSVSRTSLTCWLRNATALLDGVVFEAPIVPYYATYESEGETVVVGAVFNWESPGIVFSTGRLLRKQVDEAL